MDTPKSGPFGLVSQRLGALPLISHFLDRIGLDAALGRWLPEPDRRFKLTPAAAIRLLVVNLLVGRAPLYGLDEWAAPYAPGLLGLPGGDTAWLNDDRVGRALVTLFDADRASLLTDLIVGVIREFHVDTAEMHNDSTSVSVHGEYRDADGRPRRGKPTAAVAFGHSKDHRPDLKQLVWILTVSADGSVPMAYRLADGNTSDDPTHIPTWDALVKVLDRRDFLYIADSKLCSGEAMRHIDSNGGRFVTVLPRTRGEDKWFRDWLQTNQPQWTEAIRLPGERLGDLPRIWSTFPSPLPSAEGYRVIWVHSTVKAARDEHARRSASRPAPPPSTSWPSAGRAEDPAQDPRRRRGGSSGGDGQDRLDPVAQRHGRRDGRGELRQDNRGRPGADTRYRRTTRTRHTLTWATRDDIIAYDAGSDGCFPLITNDSVQRLPDKEVLVAYRYQPNLERRHHLLKSVQDADPIWLRDPARIEAIFCCQFLALLVGALIERQIRTAMRDVKTRDIPLYPELRACEAPSAERILAVFADLTRHELHHDGRLVQTFEAELTPLQQQILDLLGVPATAYSAT
jgi:hypothetical protein